MASTDTLFGREAAQAIGLDRHMPVVCHVTPDTLITKDGALLRIIEMKGFPAQSCSPEEIQAWKDAQNLLLRTIQSPRLQIWTHWVRREVKTYPEGTCQSAFARSLDDRYRESLSQADLFESALYLTLVWQPPSPKVQSFISTIKDLFRDDDGPGVRPEDLKDLDGMTRNVEQALSRYAPEVLGVYALEQSRPHTHALEFLAELVNGRPERVPAACVDAGEALLRAQLQFGRDHYTHQGNVRREYAGILSLKEYSTTTEAACLDSLQQLSIPFVLTQSYSFIHKNDGLGKLQTQERKMVASNDLAQSQVQQIRHALDQLVSNEMCLGYHHMTLSTRAPTKEQLDRRLSLAQNAMSESAGLIAKRERLGAEAAFWAQIPSNHSYINRKALITSLNFASFNAFHNAPSGSASGNHWGNAVSLLKTQGQSPYFFNFHHPDDLGNAVLIGPSGAGKTVLALFLMAQLEKHDVTRIYFDKDRGAEIAIRAMGGTYSNILAGEPTGFNPLQCEDTPANREFIDRWLRLLLRPSSGELTEMEEQAISMAVSGVFEMALKDRRLSNIHAFFQATEPGGLRDRLQPWLENEARGWVFDNADDHLAIEGTLQGFDVTEFLDEPALRTPILLYLFHRIDQMMDGRRICLALDEGWKLLDDPAFSKTMKDWLKVIRKKNGITFFATQEPHDVLGSSVAKTIMSQSPTQIFLPNRVGRKEDYVDGFMLTPREFELVTELPPRHFLLKQGTHVAVIDFNLAGLDDEIAVLSGTTANVRLLDELREEHSEQWYEHFHTRRKS